MAEHTIEKDVKHVYAMDQSTEYPNGSKGVISRKTVVKSVDSKANILNNLMFTILMEI